MSQEKFFEWLYEQSLADRLVLIRYKYQFETKWTYSTEVLEVDLEGTPSNCCYAWLNDWNEGQQCIEILGCQRIDSIDVSNVWN